VVYAGLGHTALRDRITDAEAKVVIVGDVGFRRGKTVALKAIVDEAVENLEFVEKVVVYSRAGAELTAPREIDFNDLLKFAPDCPAEEMDAEDPLFLLYTSGSTGKPKGVVHVHGGYMVWHHLSFGKLLRCGRPRHFLVYFGHWLGGRTFLYRLRAAVRRCDHAVPRRSNRLSESWNCLGNRLNATRDQNVYRAHRVANVHALRRSLSRSARSDDFARDRLRGRTVES